MATIKLTDIVEVMKSKWIYGDKKFGFTEEFNDNHNTIYPSLLVTPPDSVFPEVGVNSGWEEYSFLVYFSDLYTRTDQQNETIDQRWENLQDLATEWLDDFLKHYQAETTNAAPIQAFLQDESLTLERVKEVANDQLLQIRMSFTWKVFSKCFRPVSTSPNTISDLVVWLRADAGTTFTPPFNDVSIWQDQSGNDNSVRQSTKANRPTRLTYGGAKDKTRIVFSGSPKEFVSSNNCPITGNDLSIFYVAKADATTTLLQRVVGYREGGDRLNFGVNSLGRVNFKALDDNGDGDNLVTGNTELGTVNHIACARINDLTFHLQYNNNTEHTVTATAFNNSNGFNQAPFNVGHIDLGAADTYFRGHIQEIIIYNRFLSNNEKDKVVDYLNKKYKIY